MKKKLLFFATAMLLGVASAFAQGGTTGPLTWNISGGILTITVTSGSTGAMPNYAAGNPPPWYSYNGQYHTVIIGEGVTRIGNYAFYYNIYDNTITSVTIPNSVTSIGEAAFRYCRDLTSVIIPNSVTNIGIEAFYECGLTSITILLEK